MTLRGQGGAASLSDTRPRVVAELEIRFRDPHDENYERAPHVVREWGGIWLGVGVESWSRVSKLFCSVLSESQHNSQARRAPWGTCGR